MSSAPKEEETELEVTHLNSESFSPSKEEKREGETVMKWAAEQMSSLLKIEKGKSCFTQEVGH